MRQYILTERAHLMCPNMHFGIKAKISAGYDRMKIEETLRALEAAHPFLKCRIAKDSESGRLYYRRDEEMQVPLIEKNNPCQWADDYRELTRDGWDAFHECLLKFVIYPSADGFDAMFMAHHLLGDGRSILNLMCEFVNCYISREKPTFKEENLIASIADLPKGSQLSTISKLIIGFANRKWRNERHSVSYERYRCFEKEFIANNPVSFAEESWSEPETQEILKKCHELGVSMNDYLVADMMRNEKTNRIVIAADIRKNLSHYQSGALGNYASATAIKVSKTATSLDVWNISKLVSEQVKQNVGDPQKLMMILSCYLYMEPELIDAAAISAIGGFESKAGRFVGSSILGYQTRNGYSITNLGNVDHPNIVEAMFIPPASPANIKTMGVLSVNRRLKKCTACYQ